MTLALYAIADEYRHSLYDIQQTLGDIEIDEDAKQSMIADTLSTMKDTFEFKALNVASFIANLKYEAIAVKTAEQRMTKRRRSLERQVDGLSDYLFCQMQKMDIPKLSNDQLVVAIKKNPAKVCITNEKILPEEYKETVQTTKVIKSSIANSIKNGQDIAGAHLETSYRLDIR